MAQSVLCSSATLVALTAVTGGATAAPPGGQVVFDADSINYEPPPVSRRGGFAMSVTAGLGAGVYRGYPLRVDALNDPNQRQSTGAAAGNFFSLWVGAAPRDWLTLGVGALGLRTLGPGAGGGDINGGGGALGAHVEGYPLFSRGGLYRDLGLGFGGGIGMVQLMDPDSDDDEPVADSGALSTLSFDAFWEPWRVWNFSFGPALNYTHGFSQSMTVNQVTLCLRSTLYGIQPKKKSEGT